MRLHSEPYSQQMNPYLSDDLTDCRFMWLQLYVVAENRIMKINLRNIGTSESALEVFFGPESGEIIGLSVSTSISCIVINVKNRALFAFRLHGKPLWSAGPVIYQNGYRQGCRKSTTNCYFTSVPVIDHCEASIYVSSFFVKYM